jgi:hypothetical protein
MPTREGCERTRADPETLLRKVVAEARAAQRGPEWVARRPQQELL